MKKMIVLLSCLLVLAAGCKTKKTCDASAASQTGKTCGLVSHQYKSSGCGPVIVINNPDADTPAQILIPKDPIPATFDKDGLRLYFNFRLLKMPNPEGCSTGNMAEITDLSK